MSLPALSKIWNFGGINTRITFVSLNDCMSKLLFGIKNYLVATMGWSVVYTCDGTTGPTSAGDNTDRWTAASKCTTRGASAGTAQSFAVLTDGNGVQILLAYQGASDDVCRISISNGALFTPAGTANQQPTATDELIISTGITVIGATASADRVYSIVATTDKRLFRVWIYRSAALQRAFGVEQCSSVVAGSFNWSTAVVGWNQPAIPGGSQFVTAGGWLAQSPDGSGSCTGQSGSAGARIGGTSVAVGGGGEGYGASGAASLFTVAAPQLQGASPLVPLVFSSVTTNFNGKLGNRFDAWFPYCNGILDGDNFGSFAFMYLNGLVQPWDGASALVTS